MHFSVSLMAIPCHCSTGYEFSSHMVTPTVVGLQPTNSVDIVPVLSDCRRTARNTRMTAITAHANHERTDSFPASSSILPS